MVIDQVTGKHKLVEDSLLFSQRFLVKHSSWILNQALPICIQVINSAKSRQEAKTEEFH